jgi:hypothetical protein
MRMTWSKVDARWYLGVHCSKCKTPILFALDYSDRETKPEACGKLLLTCVHAECRHRADYTTAPILRFQKQPQVPNETGGHV